MSSFGRLRPVAALPLALLLTMVLALDAVAASWTAPVPLAMSGTVLSGGLVGLSTTSAVAVYRSNGKILTRRTADSGATWKAPVRVSKAGHSPAIAGLGSDVDVVWVQHGKVHYRHSANGGSSFGPALELGSVLVCGGLAGCSNYRVIGIARSPAGNVAVTWTDQTVAGDPLYMRISTDGGATFGPASSVAHGPRISAVAYGDSNLYFAYVDADGSVHAKTFDGTGWIGGWYADDYACGDITYFNCTISLTAVGTHAYLAWVDLAWSDDYEYTWIRYGRTIDGGASWSGTLPDLSPSTGTAEAPHIALNNGVVRLAFHQWTESDIRVVYRQSSNGTTWTTPYTVATDAYAGGVGWAGRTIVSYYTADGNAYARTRTP